MVPRPAVPRVAVSAATGEGSNITANAKAQVSSDIGSGATISAPGPVTITASGTNIADADATTLSVGIALNVAAVLANATASGADSAYLGNGAVIGNAATNAGSLVVQATGADQSSATVDLSGGGAFSGEGGNATAKTSPALSAYLGNSSSVNVSGNITVLSKSTTEADANSTGKNSGIVAVGESLANAFVTPTLNTYIGSIATIIAGGTITVQSENGTQPVPLSQGTFTPSQVNNNQISFSQNDGLQTGDIVTYSQNGNPPIGGLTDGAYSVVAFNANTVELGPAFDGFKDVNMANDTIDFTGPDYLQTGDLVIYQPTAGSVPIGGLTAGHAYLVRVIDPETIKLVNPAQGLQTPTSFDPATTVSNNTIHLSGFSNGQAVTYTAPGPLEVAPQQISNSTINLGTDANGNIIPDNFTNGEGVIYNPAPGATTIGGLTPGKTYFVIAVAANEFQLSATEKNGNPGARITLNVPQARRASKTSARQASNRSAVWCPATLTMSSTRPRPAFSSRRPQAGKKFSLNATENARTPHDRRGRNRLHGTSQWHTVPGLPTEHDWRERDVPVERRRRRDRRGLRHKW